MIMIKNENITDRIVQIMTDEGHTVSTFARKLGISWTSANNIVSGRNAPNYETIVKIIESFDNIDANWLILGRKSVGDADTERLYSLVSTQQKIIENQQKTIDRLTIKLVENTPDKTSKKVADAV
nr:MAG TPA: helix-turn-helix domain protein [Caudoviricetes sp.]